MRSLPWSPRSPPEWNCCCSDATVMCSRHPTFVLPVEFVLTRVHCTGQNKLITCPPLYYDNPFSSSLSCGSGDRVLGCAHAGKCVGQLHLCLLIICLLINDQVGTAHLIWEGLSGDKCIWWFIMPAWRMCAVSNYNFKSQTLTLFASSTDELHLLMPFQGGGRLETKVSLVNGRPQVWRCRRVGSMRLEDWNSKSKTQGLPRPQSKVKASLGNLVTAGSILKVVKGLRVWLIHRILGL